ncbi:MAG: glycosyltransferase family 2 protein [Acidimicrobiales bacterium]
MGQRAWTAQTIHILHEPFAPSRRPERRRRIQALGARIRLHHKGCTSSFAPCATFTATGRSSHCLSPGAHGYKRPCSAARVGLGLVVGLYSRGRPGGGLASPAASTQRAFHCAQAQPRPGQAAPSARHAMFPQMSRGELSVLSVILPNFNHATHLARSLTTLLQQDRPPDEVIVVDDGSTDHSVAVIAEMVRMDPRVRLLTHGTNRGVIHALNTGLTAACGDYVYLAAADDWVLPGFFELALRRLEEHSETGLFCGRTLLVDGATRESIGERPAVWPSAGADNLAPAEVVSLLRRSDNWILTGAAVFRRSALTWAGPFLDPQLGSFADGFVARKIALKFGLYFEPVPVAVWQVFQDSVSRQRALDPAQAADTLAYLPSRIQADPAFPSWYPEVFARRWRFTCCRLALERQPPETAVLRIMGIRSQLDRLVVAGLGPGLGYRWGRRLALAWLWGRLRPMSLGGLARTRVRLVRHRGRTPRIVSARPVSPGGEPDE